MKKITTILLSVILVMAFLCGCKKEEGTMSNEYTVTIDNNNDVYAEVPLTYTEGFASDIAVIGENDFNTEGSEALHSESALLIDASTGKVLFMKNPHKKQYPASTTKVLTSLIALKYGDKSSVRKVGDEVIINESNVILCDYRMGDLIPMEEFRKVLSLGLTPVLPHPERYFYLSESELMSFIEAGVQIQSNYGSLAGLYGSEAQENARRLITGGLVSHFGTDMHNDHYIRVIGKWFAEGNPIEEYPTSK